MYSVGPPPTRLHASAALLSVVNFTGSCMASRKRPINVLAEPISNLPSALRFRVIQPYIYATCCRSSCGPNRAQGAGKEYRCRACFYHRDHCLPTFLPKKYKFAAVAPSCFIYRIHGLNTHSLHSFPSHSSPAPTAVSRVSSDSCGFIPPEINYMIGTEGARSPFRAACLPPG